jgi:hypothetical protein
MADIRINEVHTEMEITDSVGSLDAAEVKKLVSLVLEHLKAHQEREELRRRDDTIRDRAYASDGND